MFNNIPFNYRKIKDMDIQMTRLYSAAKTLRNAEGPSAVAKLMNISPQTVKNWEARGISDLGLLQAQEFIGCNAIWLRDGTGKITADGNDVDVDQIIELITLFKRSTARGRDNILDLARSYGARGDVAEA